MNAVSHNTRAVCPLPWWLKRDLKSWDVHRDELDLKGNQETEFRGGRLEAQAIPRERMTAAESELEPVSAERALLLSQYRELTRKHLGRLLDRLIADFTGLRFHVAWAPALRDDPPMLPKGCSVCCRLASAGVEGAVSVLRCGVPRTTGIPLSTAGSS